MGHRTWMLAIAVALGSRLALAQPAEPKADTMWTLQAAGTEYHLIPYDLIDRAAHKKLRKMIGGVFRDTGYSFFVAAVDNTKGKSPVTFSAFEGTVSLQYSQPGGGESGVYPMVDLRNHFADPDNTPYDKEAYEKVKTMFRADVTVPPGKTGWSLVVFQSVPPIERMGKVTWALPGQDPLAMKERKYDPSLVKKLGIELVPWD